MESNQKPLKIILVLIASIALIGAAWIHGKEIADSRVSDTISVTGSVKRKVDSDLAKWTAGFTQYTTVSGVTAALTKTQKTVEDVKQFIVSFGIDEKSITILPAQTDPVYEQSPNYGFTQRIIAYNIRQEIRVENMDIGKLDQLAKSVTRLADKGIVADYQRTEYFYTKIADLRPELFAEATKDAQKRAEAIAGGTGVKVGALRSARTGVIQILAPNSTDIADYGAYDLSTKEKEVTATVSVSFALER